MLEWRDREHLLHAACRSTRKERTCQRAVRSPSRSTRSAVTTLRARSSPASLRALAKDTGLRIILTGPAEVVEPFAAATRDRVEAVACTEIIEMDEHPATAVRTKKDSSIVVGRRLVKEGTADAFFSAGSRAR